MRDAFKRNGPSLQTAETGEYTGVTGASMHSRCRFVRKLKPSLES